VEIYALLGLTPDASEAVLQQVIADLKAARRVLQKELKELEGLLVPWPFARP